MKSLYTDKETEELIEKLKAKDENFNLSSFVKRALTNHLGDNSNIDVIRKNLQDCRLSIEKYQNELNYWLELEKKAILHEELTRLKLMEEEKNKLLETERREKLRKNRAEFTQIIVKQEIGRELNDYELNDFLDGMEEGIYSHINQYLENIK
jgi:hypothetical protein